MREDFAKFAEKLSGDENKLLQDEQKVARDRSKEDAFSARLADNSPAMDMSLANMIANDPAIQGRPMPASSMSDAAPVPLPDVPAAGSARARMLANIQGVAPPPGMPLDQVVASNMQSDTSATNYGRQMDAAMAPGTLAPAQAAPVIPPKVAPPIVPVAKPAGVPGAGLLAADNKALLANYDEQKLNQQKLNAAGVQRQEGVSRLGIEEAARQQKLIADNDKEFAHRDELAIKYRDDTSKLNDAIMSQRIDPNRAFGHGDSGMKAGLVIGGFLGGISSALNGGENVFLKQMNGIIDRDIDAQKTDLDTKHKGLAQRNSILGQMMQSNGDYRLSRLQTQSALLESFKTQIAAQTEALGIPEAKIKGDAAITGIDLQQKQLKKQIDEAAAHAAAAQAAAARAAQERAEDRAFGRITKMTELEQEQQKIDQAKLTKGKLTDEQKGQISSDEFNNQIDNIAKSPVLDDLGLGTAALAKFGQRLAPDSNKVVSKLDQFNTQILQAVGKVAKDADGKPNIAMIERLEERFSIHPTDTKEMALTKIEGARRVVNALARQQGATAPEPNSTQMPASVSMK